MKVFKWLITYFPPPSPPAQCLTGWGRVGLIWGSHHCWGSPAVKYKYISAPGKQGWLLFHSTGGTNISAKRPLFPSKAAVVICKKSPVVEWLFSSPLANNISSSYHLIPISWHRLIILKSYHDVVLKFYPHILAGLLFHVCGEAVVNVSANRRDRQVLIFLIVGHVYHIRGINRWETKF